MRRVSEEEKRDNVARHISRARDFTRTPRMRPEARVAVPSLRAWALGAA